MPGEVIFIQVGHGVLMSFFVVERMEREAGDIGHGAKAPPISFGHLVKSPDQVQQIIDHAADVGGSEVTPATRRSWGGVSGHFADPDGFRWEVAWNPGFKVSRDGDVEINAVSED